MAARIGRLFSQAGSLGNAKCPGKAPRCLEFTWRLCWSLNSTSLFKNCALEEELPAMGIERISFDDRTMLFSKQNECG